VFNGGLEIKQYKGASFYDLYVQRNEANIGKLINEALDAIEEANSAIWTANPSSPLLFATRTRMRFDRCSFSSNVPPGTTRKCCSCTKSAWPI